MRSASKTKTTSESEVQVPNGELEQLLQLQRDVLEMIALGHATDDILDQICLLSEAMVPVTTTGPPSSSGGVWAWVGVINMFVIKNKTIKGVIFFIQKLLY